MPLTRHGVYRVMDNMWADIQKLREITGAEYAPNAMRPFENFEREAEESGKTKEQTLWGHLFKHTNAIRNWIDAKPEDRPAMVAREPIEGRIDDAILFLSVLRAMIEQDKLDEHAAEHGFEGIGPGLMLPPE